MKKIAKTRLQNKLRIKLDSIRILTTTDLERAAGGDGDVGKISDRCPTTRFVCGGE